MEIPRLGQDADVARMAVALRIVAFGPSARHLRMLDLVGTAKVGYETPVVAKRVEHCRAVGIPYVPITSFADALDLLPTLLAGEIAAYGDEAAPAREPLVA